MGILLAFTPFILFAVVDLLVGPTPGLLAGAALSAVLLLRDWIGAARAPKVLEIGTVVLFGGLALVALMRGAPRSIIGVRLDVDAGLLLIVLVSIAIRRPFTLQYARERVARERWETPGFVRTNYVISAVWALAFAVMVAADLVLLYAPQLPSRIGIVATILALVGAVKFTSWYPDHRHARIAG